MLSQKAVHHLSVKQIIVSTLSRDIHSLEFYADEDVKMTDKSELKQTFSWLIDDEMVGYFTEFCVCVFVCQKTKLYVCIFRSKNCDVVWTRHY